MDVELVNDGPVTLLLDSRKTFDPPHCVSMRESRISMRRRLAFVSMMAVLIAAAGGGAAAAARDRRSGDDRLREHPVRRRLRSPEGDLLSGVRPRRRSAASPGPGPELRLSSIAELQIDGGLYNRLNVNDRAAGAALRDARLHRRQHQRLRGHRRRHEDSRAVRNPGPSRARRPVRDDCRTRATRTGSGSTRPTSTAAADWQDGPVGPARRQRRARHPGRSDARRSAGDVLAYGFSGRSGRRRGSRSWARSTAAISPTTTSRRRRGTDTRAAMRFGGRFTHRTVRIDGGVIVGLTKRDPELGDHRRRHLGVPRVHG